MNSRCALRLVFAASALAAVSLPRPMSAQQEPAGRRPVMAFRSHVTSIPPTAFTAEGRGEVSDIARGRRFRAKPGEKLFLRAAIAVPNPTRAEPRLTEFVVKFRTSVDGPSLRSVELLDGSHRKFFVRTLLRGDYSQKRVLAPNNLANAWRLERTNVTAHMVVRLEVQYPTAFHGAIDPGEFIIYSVDTHFPRTPASFDEPGPEPALPASSGASAMLPNAVIYAVTEGNDLLWYAHMGRPDGTSSWGARSGSPVGTGWDFKHVFSGGNGVIYAITHGGDLLWYRHDGRGSGAASWASGPKRVGTGWGFPHVFPGGGGVIYAITESGELLWYRHEGRDDGTARWARGAANRVGVGWRFRHVFAGDNGVIYGINDTGDLLWYRHDGYADGSVKWASEPKRVGNGWNFSRVFSAGAGVIYAVTASGQLLWYRHDGFADGSVRWAAGAGTEVGTGWTFKHVLSGATLQP